MRDAFSPCVPRLTISAVNMMPLFHVGGIVRNLLAPLLSGGSAIMCAGFDAIAFWRLAIDLKATWSVTRVSSLMPSPFNLFPGITRRRLFTTPSSLRARRTSTPLAIPISA